MGLSLLARCVSGTKRRHHVCSRAISGSAATQPGQQGSEDASDCARGEVKEKIEDTPAKREIRPAAWNLEIKVREQDLDGAAASEREVALLATAQRWIVRLRVLVAVFSISAIYVGAHVGSGWVPADDGILCQSALRVMQGQLPQRDFAEIYTGG